MGGDQYRGPQGNSGPGPQTETVCGPLNLPLREWW
jgi:hypothetical protein